MSAYELIFSIYKDITKSETKLFKTFYKYLFIAFCLYFADSIFGFTYYNNIDNKIEKTKEINSILKDSLVLNKNEILYFKKLRTEVLHRKTIKDDIYSFFSNISFTSSKNPITTKPIETNPIIERNFYLHFITSAFPIILVMVIFFFAGIFDRKTTISQRIGVVFFVEIILYPFAFLFSKTLYLIPLINNTPLINYIINFSISTIIFPLTIYLLTKIGKNK
jgi:hypothetical protein